ncbi:MAG: hypothetical protein QXT63_08605, partial [Thermoplasmata archaeon]
IEQMVKDIPKEMLNDLGLENEQINDEKIEQMVKDIPKEMLNELGLENSVKIEISDTSEIKNNVNERNEEKEDRFHRQDTDQKINEKKEFLEDRKLTELKNDDLPIHEWIRAFEIRAGLNNFFETYTENVSGKLTNSILDARIKYWSSIGINVNRLLNLKDEPPERIARGLSIFEQDALKLLLIKYYLKSIEPLENDEPIFSLSSKLDDVVKLFVAQAEFERLLLRIREKDVQKLENEITEKIPSLYLSEKSKFWNTRGFNTEVLTSISGLDLRQTIDGVTEYENAISKLVSYTEEIASIDSYMLEEEVAKIRHRLKDVRNLEAIPNEILKLKEKAKEIEKEGEKVSVGIKNRMGICPMCGSPVLRQALSCPVCRFTAFREFTRNKDDNANADDNFEKEMKKELRKRREYYRLIALWTGKELPYSPNITSSQLESKFNNIVEIYNRMFLHIAYKNAYSNYLGLEEGSEKGLEVPGLDKFQNDLFSNLSDENYREIEEDMLSRIENLKKESVAKRIKKLDLEREEKMLKHYISDLKEEGFNLDGFISNYKESCGNVKTIIREIANRTLILRSLICEINTIKSLLDKDADKNLCIDSSSVNSLLKEIDEIQNKMYNLSFKDEVIEKRNALFAKICELSKAWISWKIKTKKETAEKKEIKQNEEKERSKVSSIEVEEFRSHLRDMIFEYESRGYNVEILDNALTLGLEDMKRILDDFESKAKRLENVKDRFAKLDIVGFEDEAEELITYLTDVSYVEESEKWLGELERKVTEKANKHKSKIVKKNEQRVKKMQKEIIDGKKLMKLAIKGKK